MSAQASSSTAVTKREWIIKKECELRCEVPENSTVVIKVLIGSAEIFGVELALNKEYIFRDQNIAVFTWYGCTVECTSMGSSVYLADSTPMVSYVNTHIQLEARRDVALANNDVGPRVLVVGPVDHGKSSFTQILTTYATRLDRNPILVDLDVGQPLCSIPGTIAAIPLDKLNLSVEEGFVSYNPLFYFFGHTSPKDNIDHYKMLVSTLATSVYQRLEKDADAKASGIVINTCGWVEDAGYDILLHCVHEFNADVVLVMGQDKLFSRLTSSLEAGPSKAVVVKLPVSGGVVARDVNTRKRLRKNKIREYFYGRPPAGAAPNTMLYAPERREGLQLSSFTFLRVGGVQLTEGMKIIDQRSAHQESCKLVRVDPTTELVYSVVAVLHESAVNEDKDGNVTLVGDVPQHLLRSNVAGFVSIVQIAPEKDRMTILSPCPGALPSSYLLVGSVKWIE